MAVQSLLASDRRGTSAAPRTGSDLVTLFALRELETCGPLSGLDLADRTARLARLVAADPAGYGLLHDLVEEGLLDATPGRPPRYRVTEAGRAESRRLAEAYWPLVEAHLRQAVLHLAPASGVMALPVPAVAADPAGPQA